jgi:hypothetical protein
MLADKPKTSFTKKLFANIGAICNFTTEFNGLVSKSEPFRFHGVAHLLLKNHDL